MQSSLAKAHNAVVQPPRILRAFRGAFWAGPQSADNAHRIHGQALAAHRMQGSHDP